MFQLLNLTKVKLEDANPRSELHGKEHVPAIDLKFAADFSNDVLNEFHVELLMAHYKKAEGQEATPQAELEGVPVVSSLPNLRFPKMKQPLNWDLEGTGYTLTIDHGMGGRSNLVLGGCKIDGFKFALKEGGTVTVSWRLQASKVADKEMGKLCSLIQRELEITLVGPEEDQQSIGGDGAPATGGEPTPKASEDDATTAFVKQHTQH